MANTPLARVTPLAIAFCVALTTTPIRAETTDIRFYHLHKQDGQVRIRAKGSEQTGCHNFGWRKKTVHRVAQTGFSWCSLYSEADCPADKTIAALWSGKQYRLADIDISQPQSKLLRGSQWQFPEKNVAIKSWYCAP